MTATPTDAVFRRMDRKQELTFAHAMWVGQVRTARTVTVVLFTADVETQECAIRRCFDDCNGPDHGFCDYADNYTCA